MAAGSNDSWFCENDGGLGIAPCEGTEMAVVTLRIDPAFTGRDGPTIDLCDECAVLLREHAENLGYDVEEL
jgi:hypothetical protein